MKLIPNAITRTFRRRLKPRHLVGMDPDQIFETIYKQNAWKGTDSVSGTGSDRTQTAKIVDEFPGLLRELQAKSILDIPCGDFFWMQEVDLAGIQYVGADIVPDLVERNRKFENDNCTFVTLDLISNELPPVDVVFCRDCLVHFSNDHVWQALRNIAASRSRFLITTTFTTRLNDKSIVTGQWRPLNLQAEPFLLPTPVHLFDEKCTQDGGKYPDKMLGVWKIEDVRSAVEANRNAA